MAETLTWKHFLETLATVLGTEPSELKRETHLYSDVGIDSLGIFSVGMRMINTYKVHLPLALVSGMKTVGDMFDAMEKAVAEKGDVETV
jgi:acyl carrier protein